MSAPLSVFIITQDEADRVGRAIASVRSLTEDIVVVDSGSTDLTLSVAKRAGATTIMSRQWEGYGRQKRFAESQCRNRWVLNLDADEELSEECQAEIARLFANGEPADAIYTLDIRILLPHETKLRRFAPNNVVRRLYPKDKATFRDSPVHDSVIPKGARLPVHAIRAPVRHRCYRSYTHMIDKVNSYTSAQAADMVARGKRVPHWRIIAEPFVAFLKAYVGRRYCLLGTTGVLHSAFYSYRRTMRLAKFMELTRSDKA